MGFPDFRDFMRDWRPAGVWSKLPRGGGDGAVEPGAVKKRELLPEEGRRKKGKGVGLS